MLGVALAAPTENAGRDSAGNWSDLKRSSKAPVAQEKADRKRTVWGTTESSTQAGLEEQEAAGQAQLGLVE